MHSSAAFLATLALTLPSLSDGPREAAPPREVANAAPVSGKLPILGFRPAAPAPFRAIEEARRPPVERQVRIEQRVIIRISPSRPETRERSMAQLPRRQIPERFAEEPIEGCVPVDEIASVQPVVGQNRLLLVMRDRRVLSASLERTCSSADFYSGFYVERQPDGALCSRRDRLQSRAGASCRVTQFHRLVAVRD